MSTHPSSRSLVMFLLTAAALSSTAAAQLELQSPNSLQRLRVNLSFPNGACDRSAHATLIGMGGIIAEGSVDETCSVSLEGVAAGTYRISVSGQTFSRVDSDSIIVDSSGASDLEIKIGSASLTNQAASPTANPLISAADLKIPGSARKELAKALDQMEKQNWQKAIERLNHAIAIDPNYSDAYNNLGVVYGHLGNRDQESAALQKAISVNERCAPAYVNLARMRINDKNFPDAEDLLTKAATYDPNDATALVLLSYAEFTNKHFDAVIATARKAHTLAQNHAFVHWMAARALEQNQNRIAERQAELKLFLQEEPTGERATTARRQLAILTAAR